MFLLIFSHSNNTRFVEELVLPEQKLDFIFG